MLFFSDASQNLGTKTNQGEQGWLFGKLGTTKQGILSLNHDLLKNKGCKILRGI